nr:MAG TPA: hypothetical protein [Bacteriophage sp.]
MTVVLSFSSDLYIIFVTLYLFFECLTPVHSYARLFFSHMGLALFTIK